MLPGRGVRVYDADNDSVNKGNLQSVDFIGKYYICVENVVLNMRFAFIFRMVCAELLFTG